MAYSAGCSQNLSKLCESVFERLFSPSSMQTDVRMKAGKTTLSKFTNCLPPAYSKPSLFLFQATIAPVISADCAKSSTLTVDELTRELFAKENQMVRQCHGSRKGVCFLQFFNPIKYFQHLLLKFGNNVHLSIIVFNEYV